MTKDSMPGRPLVSVILAVYNEGCSIERCITSLLRQDHPDFDLEFLAVDGGSQDGTRNTLDRIAAQDDRVRVLTNTRKKTPFAFNLGLREARGEYVCIFGAHTVYKRNYISECLKDLLAHKAAGCSGRVITLPLNRSLEARLVAWIMSHPFGSSRKSFRTQAEGYVDHVNYPVMLKQALVGAGGYDEEMTRNQDNDMSQKLRANGYKLYCTWKTEGYYYTKGKLKDLFLYAWRNGFWNFISLKRNPGAMAPHHFIPFIFVLALLGSLLLAAAGALWADTNSWQFALPLAALLGAHLAAGTAAALQVAIRQKALGALWLPFAFLGFHAAYGFGTFSALAASARRLFAPTPSAALEPDRSSTGWNASPVPGLMPKWTPVRTPEVAPARIRQEQVPSVSEE